MLLTFVPWIALQRQKLAQAKGGMLQVVGKHLTSQCELNYLQHAAADHGCEQNSYWIKLKGHRKWQLNLCNSCTNKLARMGKQFYTSVICHSAMNICVNVVTLSQDSLQCYFFSAQSVKSSKHFCLSCERLHFPFEQPHSSHQQHLTNSSESNFIRY